MTQPPSITDEIITANTVLVGRWNPYKEPILYHQAFVQPEVDVKEVEAYLLSKDIIVNESGVNSKQVRYVHIHPGIDQPVTEIVKSISAGFNAHPTLKATHVPPVPVNESKLVNLTSITYKGRDYTIDEMFGVFDRIEALEKDVRDLLSTVSSLSPKVETTSSEPAL
jgi:hypothetical protein